MMRCRLATVLLLLLMTASAVDPMMLCAGMEMDAGPHACCMAGMPEPTGQHDAMICCVVAAHADDAGPVETAPAGQNDGVAAHGRLVRDAVPRGGPPAFAFIDASAPAARPPVPIYLELHSLLI